MQALTDRLASLPCARRRSPSAPPGGSLWSHWTSRRRSERAAQQHVGAARIEAARQLRRAGRPHGFLSEALPLSFFVPLKRPDPALRGGQHPQGERRTHCPVLPLLSALPQNQMSDILAWFNNASAAGQMQQQQPVAGGLQRGPGGRSGRLRMFTASPPSPDFARQHPPPMHASMHAFRSLRLHAPLHAARLSPPPCSPCAPCKPSRGFRFPATLHAPLRARAAGWVGGRAGHQAQPCAQHLAPCLCQLPLHTHTSSLSH